MSEADDLGALVLGLAERSINEYRAKPFPEDRDPIVYYFSLLDNLVDATDSPFHFYHGVPLLKTISSTQASYFLRQERERASSKPFVLALGTALSGTALVGLGMLTQNIPLMGGGVSGVIAGCAGLAYTLGRGRHAETSMILKNHAHTLSTGELSWNAAFREYAPEIRCLVDRFKKEYVQERTI